jgi:hypothetical protein
VHLVCTDSLSRPKIKPGTGCHKGSNSPPCLILLSPLLCRLRGLLTVCAWNPGQPTHLETQKGNPEWVPYLPPGQYDRPGNFSTFRGDSKLHSKAFKYTNHMEKLAKERIVASDLPPRKTPLCRSRGLFRRETHVQFWQGVGVRFPHAARLRKLVHCGCRIPLPG